MEKVRFEPVEEILDKSEKFQDIRYKRRNEDYMSELHKNISLKYKIIYLKGIKTK